MKIILGSKSVGRKKILKEMGYEFEIVPADIDEKAIRMENPKELTLAIGRAKADALKNQISEPAVLITGDQVVVYDGKIREKPENEKEAREFLESYNVGPAETVSSIVVTNLANGRSAEGVDIAKIYFNNFSKKDISELIKDGELYNFAGGFSMYGKLWEPHVKKIEGTRDSIIGLPKELTQRLIDEVK